MLIKLQPVDNKPSFLPALFSSCLVHLGLEFGSHHGQIVRKLQKFHDQHVPSYKIIRVVRVIFCAWCWDKLA